MSRSLCFFVCENFYPEMQEAVRLQGLSEVEVLSFPARCGSPPLRWEEFAEHISEKEGCGIEIFGSYCLDSLLPVPREFIRCRVKRKEQCFHMICNAALVDSLQEEASYLLSSGWLSHWRENVAQWGFDRQTAREFFGESVQRLVLLDTGIREKTRSDLKELQDFLALPSQRIPVGLDFHQLFINQIAAEYRLKEAQKQVEESKRGAADSAMTFDLIGIVTKAKTRTEVVSAIVDLFTMLFAPERVHFIPVQLKGIHFDQVPELTEDEKQQVELFQTKSDKQFLLNEDEDSFLLRLGRDEQTAVIFVVRVAFPQYIESYLNAALTVAEVCALSIEHVQTLRALVRTSHLAGKAEVATEVLHNVGNTLNSISVSSEHIQELVQQSCSASLPDIVRLIQDHKEDPESFFVHDSRGQRLPAYFAKLSEKLAEEREFLLVETTRQLHHIRRVADIIRAQQDTAKIINFTEQVNLTSLLEESLELFQRDLEKQRIAVERNYNFQKSICGEPHKILQVVNNLIRNSVDAFDGILVEQKKIALSIYPTADQNEVIVEISDNGKGMQQNILEQAFVFGFTTKKEGHGFGLHNAANLTAEMGGNLTGESAGLEQGARFKMRLPVTATGGTE
ncbi:histidine kinase [Candidatus Electrothrix aarhusensis]